MPAPWEVFGQPAQGGFTPVTPGDPMKPLQVRQAQIGVARGPVQLQKDVFDLSQAQATADAERRQKIAQAKKAEIDAGTAAQASSPLAQATEAERKAASFLIRVLGANHDYRKAGVGPRSLPGEVMADWTPGLLNNLPSSIGNSSQRQQADAAQREFVMASLRQDSGAAIPPEEISNQIRTYFPVAGDMPDVIKQKEAARRRAIAGLGQASGRLAQESVAKFAKLSGLPLPGQTKAAPKGPGVPGGAVKYLRDNPGTAAQFDAKYGQGASARYLRGK